MQNMLLIAHAQGLATLWFSLFEKSGRQKDFSYQRRQRPRGHYLRRLSGKTGRGSGSKGIGRQSDLYRMTVPNPAVESPKMSFHHKYKRDYAELSVSA